MSSVSIEFGYLPTAHGNAEPAMFLIRAGNICAIGLSVAHQFLDDSVAVRKATEYAIHLYGVAGFTSGEVFRLVQQVTNEFRTLLSMPPPPTPDLMKQAERDRLVVKADGEVLLDAR